MNIEITDLEMILDYLETTSLEPHDDYTSEFTYKDQKILYKYIKQLQQENKQQKEIIQKAINRISLIRMDNDTSIESHKLLNDVLNILQGKEDK